jgi:REP element-mobilizing transposase RayT
MVTQMRENFFGEIIQNEMILNNAGLMVKTEWEALPNRFAEVELGLFQIMPNHFHGIIFIYKSDIDKNGQAQDLVNGQAQDLVNGQAQDLVNGQAQGLVNGQAQDLVNGQAQDLPLRDVTNHPLTLGDVVGAFKSITTVEYIKGVDKFGWQPFNKRLWQRNYFEHIIRNQTEFERIINYINSNVINWIVDEENPERNSSF